MILEKLKTVDPQYNVNGMRGIWILKPSHLCCGNGIVISHSLKDILRKVEEKPKNYYVVQKYIGTISSRKSSAKNIVKCNRVI